MPPMNPLVVVCLVAVASPHPAPRWMDRLLAGYLLANDEKHATMTVQDTRSDYILARSGECDGAYQTLILSRDRKALQEGGYLYLEGQHLERKALPSLASGKGLRIGDGPSRMIRLLGKPKKALKEGDRKQYRTYVYSGRFGGFDYDERYTFRGERLVEVRFNRNVTEE